MNIYGAAAIVTGGASGLGEATARLLADRGAKVVVADLQDDKGEVVAKAIGGGFAHTDVTAEADVIAAVEAAKDLGPLRVLVNCAGIGWPQRTIGKDGEYSSAHGLDIFTKVIQINLIGTFNCIRLAATAMSQTEPLDEFGERGAIVNTASVAAFDGQIGQAAYSASKGGVVGMTLPIARDLSAVGIRVNTIAPGLDRHADLRPGRGRRPVQGPAQGRRAVPAPPRHVGGVRHARGRAGDEQLHERRDHPRRRRHPHATEVTGADAARQSRTNSRAERTSRVPEPVAGLRATRPARRAGSRRAARRPSSRPSSSCGPNGGPAAPSAGAAPSRAPA